MENAPARACVGVFGDSHQFASEWPDSEYRNKRNMINRIIAYRSLDRGLGHLAPDLL
jgi:hypothetical protein